MQFDQVYLLYQDWHPFEAAFQLFRHLPSKQPSSMVFCHRDLELQCSRHYDAIFPNSSTDHVKQHTKKVSYLELRPSIGSLEIWLRSLENSLARPRSRSNMTEDFSLKALVLGTIIMSASAEAESSQGRRP